MTPSRESAVSSAQNQASLARTTADLWGINLYPDEPDPEWIEFDSMINIRPSQDNRSRVVEDAAPRDAIRQVVTTLVER